MAFRRSTMLGLGLTMILQLPQMSQADTTVVPVSLGPLEQAGELFWRRAVIDRASLGDLGSEDGVRAVIVELVVTVLCSGEASEIQAYFNFGEPLSPLAIAELPAGATKFGVVQESEGCVARIDATRAVQALDENEGSQMELILGKFTADLFGSMGLESTVSASIHLQRL